MVFASSLDSLSDRVSSLEFYAAFSFFISVLLLLFTLIVSVQTKRKVTATLSKYTNKKENNDA